MQNFKNGIQISQQNIQKMNEKNEKRVLMVQESLNKKTTQEHLLTNYMSSKNTFIAPVNSEKQILIQQRNLPHLQYQQSLNQQNSINNQLQRLQLQVQQNSIPTPSSINPPLQVNRKSPTELIKPYLSKQNLKVQINKQKAVDLINSINQRENNILKCSSQNSIPISYKDNYLFSLKRELENDLSKKNIKQSGYLSKTRPESQDSNMFTTFDKKEAIILCEEEIKLYGSRCPEGYEKIEILGKGGFSIVWLCQNLKSQRKVAAKQILNKKNQESVQRELKFLENFYTDDGEPKARFRNDKRLKNMIGLVEIHKDQKDTWVIYDLGGITISKLFYSMKGDFHNGERVYQINFSSTYHKFIQLGKNSLMKEFIKQNAYALQLLAENKIVHCDIKPENILISMSNQDDDDDNSLQKINLIDFGSALCYNEKGTINLATPEYMPPEVISLFIGEKNRNNNSPYTMIEQLMMQGNMDVIDVWSFGASLLEILTGLPQWLSYKCRVTYNSKSLVKTGLFSIRNQDYDKLLSKQKGISDSLPNYLSHIIPMFDDQEQAELFIDLLASMLKYNPQERIKPKDILQHPFINGACSQQSLEQSRANAVEMFEKKGKLLNSSNIINNDDNTQSSTNLKSPNDYRSRPNLKSNIIDNNKSRSHSLYDAINTKRYYYEKKIILKEHIQNKININLQNSSQPENKIDRNKSSIIIASDHQCKSYDNSILSPNLSRYEIENQKIVTDQLQSPSKENPI